MPRADDLAFADHGVVDEGRALGDFVTPCGEKRRGMVLGVSMSPDKGSYLEFNLRVKA